MITLLELTLFLKQASLALTGAAALWGLYFFYHAKKSRGKKKRTLLGASHKMLEPLSASLFVFVISWFLLDFRTSFSVLAHEGVVIDPTIQGLIAGLNVSEPFAIALMLVFAAGLICRAINKDAFTKHINAFYATILALATLVISLPVWTGALDPDKLFFIGHNVHSILTLGTVLVLDFIMLVAKYADEYKKYLYPHLPAFSKVIWLGLAIDFLSVAFVFERAMEVTTQFMFMQTVVAIIIINGLFLSGPITQQLLKTIKGKTVKPLPKNWNRIATISGCISIASWTTITFTDFLKGVDHIHYLTFIGFYLAFLVVTYIVYEAMEHYKVGHNW